MDISLILYFEALLQSQASPLSPGDMVGQAYLVLNTASLIGAAFWLGVQWNTIRTSKIEIQDLKRKIDLPVVPLAEMKAAIDNLKDDVESLTDSMERFQRSIFMDAMRIGGRRNSDDPKT